jgi:protein gp37
MADGTSIEWTDATWNPITGCKVKSPGCRFCYAMKLAGTRLKHHWSRTGLTVDGKNGPVWNGQVRFNDAWLDQPLRWSRPRMIFVCAHADLFYEEVPDEWIDRVFAVMALSPQHVFQVLTKRPDRMRAYVEAFNAGERHILGWANDISGRALVLDDLLPEGAAEQEIAPLPNVWLGVSVEDQLRADERREPMRELAAAGWLTWVSYEPALEAVDWTGWEFIKWLVSGGESDTDGRSARPSPVKGHRDARDFCAAHEIAFNFKQWGCWIDADQIAERIAAATAAGAAWIVRDGAVWTPIRPLNFSDAAWLADFLGHQSEHQSDGTTLLRMKKSDAGRLLDGRTHDGFPALAGTRRAGT